MDKTRASPGLDRIGALLALGGSVAAVAAWLHMRAVAETYGVICGAGAGPLAHCPACWVSAALFAMAAAIPGLARLQPKPLLTRFEDSNA